MENQNVVRPIHEIAREIEREWNKVGKGVTVYAKAYLDPMKSLDKISDMYYCDSADSVVRYFLGNAGSFRGEAAKRLKAELKALLGDK